MIILYFDEAEEEYWAAVEYYEKQKPGLGTRLHEEIRKNAQLILDNPYMWPENSDSTRRALLGRFPYALIYKIKDDIIWITAVAHTSKEPGYWKNRSKI